MATAADDHRSGLHPASLRCGYCFHQGESSGTGWVRTVSGHAHPFWQLESVRTGSVTAHLGATEHRLEPEVPLLLPPGTRHAFTYLQGPCAYLSVKFSVDGFFPEPEACLGDADLCGPTLRALHGLLAEIGSVPADRRRAVEGILATLVACAYGDRADGEPIRDPVVRAAQRIIEGCAGRPLSVTRLATRVGYSSSRLAARFRTELGRSPKVHLDAERAALAGRLLVYSDRSVSEIAALLEFSDQFAFSRFFSRVTGESPLAYRRRGRTAP